jgi:hypothetical protein
VSDLRLCYILLGMEGQGSREVNAVRFAARWQRMVRGRAAGYTIVEVMIFLGVTTALFAMVAVTFSGRQARTEFSVATREVESRLQDIANDVSTGFYNNPGNFSCGTGSGQPRIAAAVNNAQGTNNDCIFIGRVAQFDLDVGARRQYNLYSVVGSRLGADDNDTDTFSDAEPLAIATSPRSTVDLTDSLQLPIGLTTDSMYAVDAAGNRTQIRGVGFFTTWGADTTDPSSLSVNIVPLVAAPAGNTKNDMVTAINSISNVTPNNPAGGIEICMNGDGVRQHAVFKIGGNRARLTTDVSLGDGSCDAAGY